MYLVPLSCTVKYGLKKKEEMPEEGGNEDAVKENRERETKASAEREKQDQAKTEKSRAETREMAERLIRRGRRH